MKKNLFPVIILVVVVAAVGVLGFYPRREPSVELDAFARCLAEKQVTMYGAESCSWCQKEKANFGSAFDYVPYVECPEEPQKCIAAGIQGTPTWIVPASLAGGPDGKKLAGYQGLEKLSLESGCPLRQSSSEASPLP